MCFICTDIGEAEKLVKVAKITPRCHSDEQLDPDLRPYCKVMPGKRTKILKSLDYVTSVDLWSDIIAME